MKAFYITDIPIMSGFNPGTLQHLRIVGVLRVDQWIGKWKKGCEKVADNQLTIYNKSNLLLQQRICQNQSIQVKYLPGDGLDQYE